MAVTRQNSNLVNALIEGRHGDSWRVSPGGIAVIWDFGQTDELGDPGSVIRAYQTQQGVVSMIMPWSHVNAQGMPNPTNFTVGHEAYRLTDGTVVPENLAAFGVGTLTTQIAYLFQDYGMNFNLVPSNVMITLQVTQAIPVGARFEGGFMFSQA